MINIGHFYYLNDKYFIDFPDQNLMNNKETINTQAHDRPCFYAFQDKKTNLYWLIPISSKIEKFNQIYSKKIAQYGKCDTIVFGDVLGHPKAFLIQNMCPTTESYVKKEYIDSATNTPVRLNHKLEKELIKKATKVLALQRKGIKLIFPDVLSIEKKLIST